MVGTMKKLRVLVLVHEMLVPPDSIDHLTDQQADEFRTEWDVITTLRELGHDVRPLGIGDSLTELRTSITEWQPHVCFNLLEEFGGIVTYDQHVVLGTKFVDVGFAESGEVIGWHEFLVHHQQDLELLHKT